jgi:hypothetical protein
MEYNKRKKQADGSGIVGVKRVDEIVIGGRCTKRFRKSGHDGCAPIFKSQNAI